MTFKELEVMNDARIIYLTKTGKSTQRNQIIKELLFDRALFKKLSKDDAFIVLRDIGIDEGHILNVYESLT
ncbi:MAG: hypothetical protein LBH47_02495 [Christensenellaceae bacterium]|jgi:hypothetical protein|nr:hypothetical protein [Christensenellaceae bacterium]